MKTTAKTILSTARQLVGQRGTLAIFALMYAGLLASIYGFVATREATVGQVLLTLVFLSLTPAAFFVLQAAIIHHARDRRVGWPGVLSISCKLAVVTVPIIILGVALFLILNRWEPQPPPGIAFPSSWASGGNWSPTNAQPASTPVHWPTVLFGTLRGVIFGVALPLITIRLWIETVDHDWRALVPGSGRSLRRRLRGVLTQAFAPESVFTYTVGLILFALIPYALLFVSIPAKGTRTEFAILLARLALVFVATLFGWVLTLTALIRHPVWVADKHSDREGVSDVSFA